MEKYQRPDGAECYRIAGPDGAEVVFACHGGHLISWKTSCGRERLFLSELARFGPGEAIRGGVPVIFPQFNENGPFSRHGFARKAEWTPDFENEVFTLRSSDETLEQWPFEFELTIGAFLTAMSLEIELTVTNIGAVPFLFQAALHSYFRVDDAARVSVEGLQRSEFTDNVTKVTCPPESDGISFGCEVDRTYPDSGTSRLAICQPQSKESLVIESSNFPDFVIWNPGPDHGINDLDDWRKFVCVESAQTQLGEPLMPSKQWVGRQKIGFE